MSTILNLLLAAVLSVLGAKSSEMISEEAKNSNFEITNWDTAICAEVDLYDYNCYTYYETKTNNLEL